ncbi:hypothetical protein LCGC14_2426170 [marine sediment metagenome]|uniref:Uncharacterized protein n=1 Tax=marine sediment metagenome TaxID=412755 RepID=A0A0F9BN98_9ZZZZ
MKLLLAHEELMDTVGFYIKPDELVAKAQLKKIFNLDIETTVKLIDKLRKRLDKLYEKEIDNGSNH